MEKGNTKTEGGTDQQSRATNCLGRTSECPVPPSHPWSLTVTQALAVPAFIPACLAAMSAHLTATTCLALLACPSTPCLTSQQLPFCCCPSFFNRVMAKGRLLGIAVLPGSCPIKTTANWHKLPAEHL
ncbi:hypothetical protein E2C01_029518 [Portunus trituberculatus]|uniref:Uncharacterized protein n=1 Tax=Portunus trituberculatus TaxID=210409 RepID=A0A5B7EPK3_PORTR|nr:hypothetical protein [Portunus trituberculatus]